ncbi:MAG: response regulator [Sphaerospermopsis sp. SIO1G2]|nr:response regulator [Sphaerospermopsis sp. SIO1G2]
MKNYPLPLDLILLDLMLAHGVSGYDVYDAIKEVPALKDVPVVCVSAADPNIEIPKAKTKGFNGYIAKPIRQRTFVTQLEAILSGDQTVWGGDSF